MGSINIIATIFNMRAPGMTLMKMPIFCWNWLITAFLLIAVMPVLAGVVTMMLLDRHFGTSFFNAAGGGDPLLFQHLFWFFGHPEVYIIILPAFGIISRKLFLHLVAKNYLVIDSWFMRPSPLRYCHLWCGCITCLPPVYHSLHNYIPCMPR